VCAFFETVFGGLDLGLGLGTDGLGLGLGTLVLTTRLLESVLQTNNYSVMKQFGASAFNTVVH